jgi:hypothetical protein
MIAAWVPVLERALDVRDAAVEQRRVPRSAAGAAVRICRLVAGPCSS